MNAQFALNALSVNPLSQVWNGIDIWPTKSLQLSLSIINLFETVLLAVAKSTNFMVALCNQQVTLRTVVDYDN